MNSGIEFSSDHQLAQPLVSYPVVNRYRGDIFDIFSEFSSSYQDNLLKGIAKVYIRSTLNIDLILWHPQLILDAIKR